MSLDSHEGWPGLDESSSRGIISSGPNKTPAMSDAIDIEVVDEWLPGDAARSVEAILISLFLISGFGLAGWVLASLR